MKNHTVPQALTRTASRPKVRVLITLSFLMLMTAFVLTRQTHATAPTLDDVQATTQAAEQQSDPGHASDPGQPSDADQASEADAKSAQAPARVTSGNRQIDDAVMASSERHGVDPRLVFAVMRKESRFNPRARSKKNAVGLMQIVPATAHRFHKSNPSDICQNVDCGVQYLRFLLEKFSGDVRLALAGYNAGESAVVHCGYRVPNIAETRNYVNTIIANYGHQHHPVLDPDEAWEIFNPGKKSA